MLDDDSHDEINNEEDDDVDYALAEHINETLNYLLLLEEKEVLVLTVWAIITLNQDKTDSRLAVL